MHLFIGLIYWIYFTVSFLILFLIAFFFWVSWCIYVMSHLLILIVLFLSTVSFLLIAFIYNFTVSFNFQATQSLLAYFLLFLIAFFFWVCFYFLTLSHFLFLNGLFLAVSFNLFFFLLHLFIELILLPHLIIQVIYFIASFNYSSQTLLGLFPDSLFSDVSHLCHIFVTFLSLSVTLYKREGVWTDD